MTYVILVGIIISASFICYKRGYKKGWKRGEREGIMSMSYREFREP